jgi:hypothetical protein
VFVNARTPIKGAAPKKYILFREVAPLKESSQTKVMVLGISTAVSDVAPEKAPAPIPVTVLGNEIERSEVAPEKTPLAISVRPLPIVRLLNEVIP